MTTMQRVDGAFLPLVAATATGLGAGVATRYLQGGGFAGAVTNSGAVWTLVAFAAALPATRTWPRAVAAGATALVGEVVGYYGIAAPWTGTATTRTEQVLWTLAALVFGPAAGAAAYGVRRGRPARRLAAVLGLCGVTAGEGAYLWRWVPSSRPLATLELVAAAVVALGAAATVVVPLRVRAGTLVLSAVVAGAVYVAYADPLLF